MTEKEIIVPIWGYEKIKVKRCRHKHLVLVSDCNGECREWVFCEDCGLRTPSIPHRNEAWAEEIFGTAKREGKLFRDMVHLRKIYFLNKEKNKITSSLCYSSEAIDTWWLEEEKQDRGIAKEEDNEKVKKIRESAGPLGKYRLDPGRASKW